jgi:polyisoprenyl-phosphate glycosyltransferase
MSEGGATSSDGSRAERARYSFVLPVYDEEESLPALRARMTSLLARLDGPAEVILVDDGSRDRSAALMDEIAIEDARFRCVKLSRNFGHQIAVTAGIDFAGGDAVIVMDADLQDPPEVVLEMIERWKAGFDVVYGKRVARKGESAFKKATASVFYRALDRMSEVRIPTDVGDFRLIDRRAVDAFKAMREQNRYVRGMFAWMGFPQCAVEYVREERFAGETKYPLRKMLRLAANGIVGFSTAPLRMILSLGFVVSILSFLAGLAVIVLKLLGAYTVTGWTSLMVVVFFVGGIQLVVTGVIGEYIGRIYDEVKSRPLYFVRSATGFSAAAAPRALPAPAATALRAPLSAVDAGSALAAGAVDPPRGEELPVRPG